MILLPILTKFRIGFDSKFSCATEPPKLAAEFQLWYAYDYGSTARKAGETRLQGVPTHLPQISLRSATNLSATLSMLPSASPICISSVSIAAIGMVARMK